MKTIALEFQSLFDIAIQRSGTATAAFDLALLNDISITDDLGVGDILEIPNTDYGESMIVEYYKNNDLICATALTVSNKQGGIGFMIVEQTFIVS